MNQKLNIIHFNDVYELRGIDKPGICGGADRFVNVVNRLKDEKNAIVLFSGDLWNPSKLSLIQKGEQMLPVVNNIKTAAACVGNHDLVTFSLITGFGRRAIYKIDSNV